MSEVQFNCPSCGSVLAVDASVAGNLILCPQCRNEVRVPPNAVPIPAAAAEARPPLPSESAAPAEPPPLPAAGHKPVRTTQGRTQTHSLAVAALVCSLFGCCPLMSLAAIICGHLARAQIKREPDKFDGEGMALAGLIIAYVILTVEILYLLFSVLVFGLLGAALRH